MVIGNYSVIANDQQSTVYELSRRCLCHFQKTNEPLRNSNPRVWPLAQGSFREFEEPMNLTQGCVTVISVITSRLLKNTEASSLRLT